MLYAEPSRDRELQPTRPLRRQEQPCGGSLRAFFWLGCSGAGGAHGGAGRAGMARTQLAEAIYRQRITDVKEITTLPKALRQKLAERGLAGGRPRIAQVFKSRWMGRSATWWKARRRMR